MGDGREDRRPVLAKILRKSCIFRTSFSLHGVFLMPPRSRVDVLEPPLNNTGIIVQIGILKP